MKDVRVVVLGPGAAGVAISKLLLAESVGDVIAVNRRGILAENDAQLDEPRRWLAAHTNVEKRTGSLEDAMAGADVLIGVSGPNVVGEEPPQGNGQGFNRLRPREPQPRSRPGGARRFAAIVATGRSDEPNQINNVLAFPGIFRGLLDAGARKITENIEIAAGRAIADVVKPTELSPDYIVPTVFNPNVVTAVAAAVAAVVSTTTP